MRDRHFPVFPGLLTLIGGAVEGLPLPPLHAGDALFGPAVGEVVAAPAGSPLLPGTLVSHLLGWREYGPGDVARIRIIRDLLAHGFTVGDLQGVADRLHLLAADPPPSCGSGGGVVGHRLSVLDAEIERLTRLREALARRAGLTDPADTAAAEREAAPVARAGRGDPAGR